MIDTPGVRSFGLAHVDPARMILPPSPTWSRGAADCPRGCTHVQKDCALDAWVADGHADPARLYSLRRLLASRDTRPLGRVCRKAPAPGLSLRWSWKGTKVSERSETRGRRPTSHERMTGLPWDASYHDGPAPWDIGGPQPAIVRVASGGGFAGTVLDAGCGSGDNALHVASLGFPVLGVDVAETALALAREKADDREIPAQFATADAFGLERLGRRFETVLDCGLFHTFDRDERPAYVASLAAVTEHGGTLYVLCFSDQGPDTGSDRQPRRAACGISRR